MADEGTSGAGAAGAGAGSAAQNKWGQAGGRTAARVGVQQAVATSLAASFAANKRTPDDCFAALQANNTTHFAVEELERLLAAFKRVTHDRLKATHFYEVVESELGWTNLLLRKQLFKAFDVLERGEVSFEEFCEGYSTMLRGTVPELLEFAWRLYHVTGPKERLQPRDLYTVLRLGLAGLEDVKQRQGSVPASADETVFPESVARQLIEEHVGANPAPLSRRDFSRLVLRCRRFVECLVPGFELIPQDPLHRAAEGGETAECKHLLEVDGLEVDGQDSLAWPTTPLHLAARYGHADTCQALLQRGASTRFLSREGETAFHLAAQCGHAKVVSLLLDGGADVLVENARGESVLHVAAENMQYRIVRILMSALHEDISEIRDNAGNTPLHSACKVDNWLVVDMYLEFGRMSLADLNLKNKQGRTPLAIAAGHGALRMMKKLLDLGADATVLDGAGKSLINIAVSVPDNEPVVNTLLATGWVSVDLPDDHGNTPLNTSIELQDVRVLRALLAHGADATVAEQGTGYTPLHKAVLKNWIEGVDALLGAGVDCPIVADSLGNTPLDYARKAAIQTRLLDNIFKREPEWYPNYPVDFYFAMVIFEGSWAHQTGGELVGKYKFQKFKVNAKVAAKRVKHKMVDKETLKRRLKACGLVVLEETVRIQRYTAGIVKGDLDQYAVIRIGCPLYRIQQEAEKMRHITKRNDFNKYEEFHINQDFYPDTGFTELSRGERIKMCLNIITASSTGSITMRFRGEGKVYFQEPECAGVSIAHYIKYRAMHDFLMLHSPNDQQRLIRTWRLDGFMSPTFIKHQFMDYFFESKDNDFKPLLATLHYFGHKTALVVGYLTFHCNWLLAPTIAGAMAFGIEFIPSEYPSMIDTSNEAEKKFSDQYDHPIMYAYAFFIMVWSALMVRAWGAKQKELAYRWQVQDFKGSVELPNVFSTAPVKLQFIEGMWQYHAKANKKQKRARGLVRALVAVPMMLLLVGAVGGVIFGIRILSEFVDDQEILHSNFHTAFKKRNLYGTLAMYGVTGLNAVMVWVLDSLCARWSQAVTNLENQETIQSYDNSLASKLLVFKFVNNFSTLFYFAYYEKDIDKTAMAVAAIMIVTRLLEYTGKYVAPWLTSGGRAKGKVQKGKKGGGVAKTSDGDKAIVPAEGGPVAGEAPDIAETVEETHSVARTDMERRYNSSALELADVFIQFGFIALWGAVWPLAALVAFLASFFEGRFYVWKLATVLKRPISERAAGLDRMWMITLDVFAVLGITNHCFLLGMSTKTMVEYFFPNITTYQRVLASFAAENAFLIVYATVRLFSLNKDPKWVAYRKKEPLRYIRDAHRAACALRETRYRLLAAGKAATMHQVCKSEDLDVAAANRYLLIGRFLDALPREERAQFLHNSAMTITSMTTYILLKKRGLQWTDGGELPTAAALLRQLVPKQGLGECYTVGRQLREATYWLWDANEESMLAGSSMPAAITAVRQLACVHSDCSLPQAERYIRLVRYVDSLGGNPWIKLEELAESYPKGLLEALASIRELNVEDEGEPAPRDLGPTIEPLALAEAAYNKADVLRRRMYENWLVNKHLREDELVAAVAKEIGQIPAQLDRYLLIRRYCDSLEEKERSELLDAAKAKTLALVKTIDRKLVNGEWRDSDEPSFLEYIPPIVVEAITSG